MNLHQFRFVREAVRQNFNLTEAAKALFTSQPGVSKAIIELEEELGIDIFSRHGKRIRGLTEPGRQVLKSVELILQEIEGLKRIGKEFAAQDMGSLTIATTHTQARYSLPTVVQAFAHKFPKVRLSLLQGNPKQVAEMVLNGQADLAIATEAIAEIDGLMRALEERYALLSVLRGALDGTRTYLRIGSELPSDLSGVSIVAAGYGPPRGNLGAVSLIGPVRMDYALAIATVREASLALSSYVEDVYG